MCEQVSLCEEVLQHQSDQKQAPEAKKTLHL